MTSAIETRIHERAYSSPSTARAGIRRSQLKTRVKNRLLGLVDEWEAQGTSEPPVVAGLLPEVASNGNAHEAELLDSVFAEASGTNGARVHPDIVPIPVNLNALIRARLTPRGVALLYEARSKVRIPDNLLQNGAVWETQLWEFMLVMANKLEGPEGDVPVERFRIEILDPKV